MSPDKRLYLILANLNLYVCPQYMRIHFESIVLIEFYCIIPVCNLYFYLIHTTLPELVYCPIHKHITISFAAVFFKYDQIVYFSLILVNIYFTKTHNHVFRLNNCNP